MSKVKAFLILAIFALLLTGCAHEQVPVSSHAATHSEVDAFMSAARSVQQKASSQVAAIVRNVSDPATRHAVEDLQTTISDLGLKLETATGKIAWYETQFDLVSVDRDKWQAQDAQDKADRVQAEKERDALIWIFSIACGMTALSAFRSALQVVQMPWQLVALAGVFVGGFSLGFMVGRYCLRFLALFTPHLPI
jgi:hypothetical protein